MRYQETRRSEPGATPAMRWISGIVAVVCTAGLVTGAALVGAQASPTTEAVSSSDESGSNKNEPTELAEDEFRSREGTEITNQPGHFRITGDRISFYHADGKKRLVCLENSNLERIARWVDDNPNHLEPPKWSVTGTITEFQGANYVFVRRAVLRSREHHE